MEKSKDLNYEILFLKCIGIFAVVAGHFELGSLSAILKYFPYYSWHMPFFILISGYLYKEQDNLKEYTIKQFKKLIIPYYLINLITGVSTFYLQKKEMIDYYITFSFKNFFLEPWLTGHQFKLNISAWFIPALFLVRILYTLIRKIIKIKNREIYIIILTLFLSLFSVYISYKGYVTNIFLPLTRTGFFLLFFAFGYFFKHFIEGKFKTNRFINIIVILIIQIILLNKFKNINFIVVFMSDFKSFIFLPIITTLTATLFLFNITKILSPVLQGNNIIKLIGSNTIAVLYGHQFCSFVSSCFFYILKFRFNFRFLETFNISRFKTYQWYLFHINNEYIFLITYGFLLILISIVVYKLLIKYVNNIKRMCIATLVCLFISIIFINSVDYLTRFYLYPDTLINFSKYGNSQKIIYKGWHMPEETYTWSEPNANIRFFTKEKKDIILQIKYNNPEFSGKVKLFYNGNELYTLEHYDEILTEELVLPLKYMKDGEMQILEFRSEVDKSLKELNINNDGRKVGISIYEMKFY